uniref:Uncharacterized protein n=1 Tax=Ananas comosus var. bracteatus TaxID=296719 RepID=A0A6V7NTM4_ANACO|nr:unnamed protein product [Ananas comosus var. bracteatus]
MIHDHQRTKGSSKLIRASSGNVMLCGNLGNIRAPVAIAPARNLVDGSPESAKELTNGSTPDHGRQLATNGSEAEKLKEMGNEEYEKGRLAEAVALFEKATLIDPDKALYRSYKAAALVAMGRLLEAVGDCREAVKIDPSFCRGHQQLANLYLRLGEVERAIHHFKLVKGEASSRGIARAQALRSCLSKCNQARNLKSWHILLKEARSAVSAGADLSPQVFAFQEEALLALRKYEEAETTLSNEPKFDTDASTKFFGASSTAYFLTVHAQVNMSLGRFEDAVALAKKASQLDPRNREVRAVARKAQCVALARSTGNGLFKASKYREAFFSYQEGLHYDPNNAILLCNRAACHSKLGQWERAIEDCNAVLNLHPAYSKARLRRADCNSKLERWEAAIQDYEMLMCEMPGDEEVSRALLGAQLQLKKQQDGEVKDVRCANFITITTKNQFLQFTALAGLSVALIFDSCSDVSSQELALLEQFCKHYPTVNFLKVDVQEDPYLTECGSSLPVFKLYKNGSSIKEIAVSDPEMLESSLEIFSK